MAVTKVEPIKGKRGGSINHLWQRTFRLVWRVQTDDPQNGVITVRTAVDPSTGVAVPTIGQSYNAGAGEVDAGSYVQGLTVEEEYDDGMSWLVTADYGPYDALQFSESAGASPTTWPIKVSFGGSRYEKTVLYDQAGSAILNSAGDPFEEPVGIDDSRRSITVVRNELCSSFDLALADTYSDSLNLNAWNGFAAKHVKLGTITTSECQYDSNNQVWYYAVTYPFEVCRDGWKKKLLDQGFAVKNISGQLVQLRGADGQPLHEPSLLDGSGKKLATGGTPVFLEFDVYTALDWSALNLDLDTRLGA